MCLFFGGRQMEFYQRIKPCRTSEFTRSFNGPPFPEHVLRGFDFVIFFLFFLEKMRPAGNHRRSSLEQASSLPKKQHHADKRTSRSPSKTRSLSATPPQQLQARSETRAGDVTVCSSYPLSGSSPRHKQHRHVRQRDDHEEELSDVESSVDQQEETEVVNIDSSDSSSQSPYQSEDENEDEDKDEDESDGFEECDESDTDHDDEESFTHAARKRPRERSQKPSKKSTPVSRGLTWDIAYCLLTVYSNPTKERSHAVEQACKTHAHHP